LRDVSYLAVTGRRLDRPENPSNREKEVRSEQIYRGCLRARGWVREEKPVNPPPLGWYRGIEDWD
jgi:hypothetical protein